MVGQLAPPAPTGREEREYLSRTVIKPLLGLTLLQEATTAAERQRANGVVAKVDAYNAASKPKRKKILGVF